MIDQQIHPRIALVTGAGRRIGRAIALRLARDGWHIGLHHNGSNAEAAEVAGLIEAAGGRAALLQADLADPQQVAGLVPACVAALGSPSCLINNASLFLPDEVGGLTLDLWERHQAINLRAPVMLAQAFAAALPAGAEGNIVNLIDQRVWKPTPLFFSYAIAKSGLLAANTMLAQALAPRIRVNAIGPGPTMPSIHQSAEQFAAECAALPLEHGTNPEEIAEAVIFLLSARAMTGQMIALDGGQHLAWQTPEQAASSGGGRRGSPAAKIAVAQPAPTFGIRHVLIEDLELMTMIGVHDAEHRAPQRVLVNVDLAVREAGPATGDRLDDVLDYSVIVGKIEETVKAGHINLVETLAERVATRCLEDPLVMSVKVRIEKPDVIANAGSVGVEIRRARP
jgi:dihydroneopterin aldolase